MGRANVRRKSVLRQRCLDPRDQVTAVSLVVGMLQLAAAALGKMAAWRRLVVRPEGQRAIVEQRVARNPERYMATASRNAIAARSDADDPLVHRLPMAAGTAFARSSAIICGPAISAARPCSHTAAQAASNGAIPRARIVAATPASTSPEPALASQHGDGGAKKIVAAVRASKPSVFADESKLLSAIENESVARVSAQFAGKKNGAAIIQSTKNRREAFRTTSMLSDAPFDPS